jgi:Fe-S-cluster containining protein
MTMNFPCKRCGRCCKTLKYVPVLADYDKGNGVCRHLKGSLCEIYENRPLICNVEMMYSTFFKDLMAEDEFIALNEVACLKIADMMNVNTKPQESESY